MRAVTLSLLLAACCSSAHAAAALKLDFQKFTLAASVFNLAPQQLRGDSGPANTPGWDSLAHISFVIGLESMFAIRLAPSDVVRMESMDATVALVARLAA
jgi:acyl carrier protein